MKYSLVMTCLLAVAPMGVALAQDTAAQAAPAATESATKDDAAAPAAEPAPAPATATASVVGKPEPGKAQVVFFRASKFTGAALKVGVFEGEQALGSLKSGSYFVLSVEPGKHEYSVNKKGKDVLPMELEAGETYYVTASISMGFVKGNSNLSPSDAAAYQADLPKMKKLGH
jgi:Protein of unknown function (DUF2846)